MVNVEQQIRKVAALRTKVPPVISPELAKEQGITPSQLLACARWHDENPFRTEDEIHVKVAEQLRAVAAELEAQQIDALKQRNEANKKRKAVKK